ELLADVAARHVAPEERHEPRFSVGIWILLSLGTAALAAALAVWFSREWGEWPRILRIALALSVPTILGLAGIVYQRRFPALGRVFLTLAAIATLSVTSLLAAMYDLHPRHAVMTFLQSALFIALAFVVDSALLLWVGMAALSMAFGFEVAQSWGGGAEWLERPIPFVGFGMLLVTAGLLVRSVQRRLGGHIVIAGALHAYFALFIICFEESTFPRAAGATTQMWLTLSTPFVIALGMIVYGWVRYGREFERALFIPFLSLLLLFAVASMWPERWYERSWVDTSLFTIATLAGAYLGVVARSPGLINTSVVFFAIDLFQRFVDWFWDVLPGYIFFGTMGVLLIAGGIVLEGVRRRLVKQAVLS
ncbi:MAG TPA: DUF2157 domain-containing protein, partial [Thermoanaerobaculia bacterium]